MNLSETLLRMARQARVASGVLARHSATERRNILLEMANGIACNADTILEENAADVAAANKAGLSSSLVDRLQLSKQRLDAMVQGIREVSGLPDVLAEILRTESRPNGLQIEKIRVPIGVIAIIYESRPNVTADSAALCLKSGNSTILRPGKEALRTCRALVAAMREGGLKAGLPPGAVQLLDIEGHEAVRELVQLEGEIDLVIPRGGERLIRAVTESARVPVIKHYKGVCHTFVDESANVAQAIEISVNAKCQRPGVCNAMETLLVHESVAAAFLPRLAEAMRLRGVELRGDAVTRRHIPWAIPAQEEDWSAEYLDLILAVKVVSGLDSAIEHINRYGSHHSDAILTEASEAAERFLKEVDSAAVYVNASTRFTDGGEFGMGAEIGISTDKLHARGPMGLEELTTYKYLVRGDGQVRA